METKTTAQEFATQLNDDGQCWTTDDGIEFPDLAESMGARATYSAREYDADNNMIYVDGPRSGHVCVDPIRYEFPDGSTIVAAGAGWDFEGAARYSWKILDRAPALRAFQQDQPPGATAMENIVIEHKWVGVLPVLLAALEDGTAEGKRMAREELKHMAQVADLAKGAIEQRDELLSALERLSSAAFSRDITMGDPINLINVKAELSEANKQARAVIAKVKGPQS